MKKLVIFLAAIFLNSLSHAVGPMLTTVILSTGATQRGGMHTSTGTIDSLIVSTLSLTSPGLITASSITATNVSFSSVTTNFITFSSVTGVNTNNSTTTYTGSNFFRNGIVVSTPGSANMFQVGTSSVSFDINGSSRVVINQTGVQIVGTNTNDNGCPSCYGAYVSSISANSVVGGTTGQFKNFISISVSSGDWDVTGTLNVSTNGAIISVYGIALSIFPDNTTTDSVDGDNTFNTSVANNTMTIFWLTAPNYRLSTSVPVTVFLKGRFDYSGGPPNMIKGRISARKPR